jgi:hypothetical protein
MIKFTELFDKLTNSSTWTNIFTDPLKMAIFMTAVILLIVFLMIKDDLSEDGNFLNIMIKTAVYVSVANLAFLFVFHGSLAGKLEEKHKSANDQKVINATLEVQPAPPVMPVTPITPVISVSAVPVTGQETATV